MNEAASKALTREHSLALIRAGEYLQLLTRRNELPLSPQEFEARVKEFFATFDQKLAAANALVLAVLLDTPVPVSFFKPWASLPTIRKWRMAKDSPLRVEILNGKLMTTPSEFFAALRIHGRAL